MEENQETVEQPVTEVTVEDTSPTSMGDDGTIKLDMGKFAEPVAETPVEQPVEEQPVAETPADAPAEAIAARPAGASGFTFHFQGVALRLSKAARLHRSTRGTLCTALASTTS